MKYAHIIAELARQLWAVTPGAMDGILAALDEDRQIGDRSIFHGAELDAIVSLLGERVGDSKIASVRDELGIIQLDGPIVPRGGMLADVSGLVSIDQLTADFKAFEADPTVAKIVFVVDSPGGSVTGVSEFASLVEKSSKPTAAYVYGFAASAAYWIASAADSITVADTGLVGSIGTVLTIRRKAEDEPIEIVSAQSPNKRPDPETDEGRRELQRIVDGLSKVFVETVARNRNTTPENVIEKFGAGGLVLAPRALAVGMVDSVETLERFLGGELAAELGEPVELSAVDTVEASDDDEKQINIDNTVKTNEKQDQRKPADAGSKPGENEMSSLKDFTAENPEAAAELDKIVSDARLAGASEANEEHNKRIELASKIIASDYPEQITAIALDVVKGEKEPAQLETAIAVFDALKTKEIVDDTIVESEATPATPAQLEQDQRSTDGVVRTEADIEAAAEEMKTR